MEKREKIINLLKLKDAHSKNEAVFELGRRLDDLSDKIDRVKAPESKDEEIEVTLSIE